MAQLLSPSARTPFPPMPSLGLRDGCAAATAASAVTDSMHAASNSALDLIIIWGPGQEDADLQAIRDHAKKLGLRMDVMETAGMSIAERERIKDDWYRSGKLGPCTQALISAHGGAFGSQGRHHLNLSTDGEPTETGALFSWLRTPPGDLPPGPQAPGWHGIAHLHSCEGGLLAAEMREKETEWNRGSFVIHAARKKIALHTLRSLAIDICDAISEGKGQPAPLTPIAMAAHAMRIAGDTIYCGGADFDAPLKIGAPRNDEQISMSTIIENLESGQHEAVRINGSQRDRAALLAAMQSQQSGREDEERYEEKLSNVMLTRMVRVRLDELEALAAAYPKAHDLAMQKAGYSNARDLNTVQLAMQRWHVAFLREVRNGHATPERLRDFMEYTGRYGTAVPEWRDEIAPALRQNPELLLVALKWDKSNRKHGLRDALSREFAAHPEDVVRLLDALRDDKDRHAQLSEFFHNTAFLREARGTPESLLRYLEYMAHCPSCSPDWRSEIAPMLRKDVGLLLSALGWLQSWGQRKLPRRDALYEVLRNEVAAHPQDVGSLYAAAQDDAERNGLRSFFKTIPGAEISLMRSMSDRNFQSFAEPAYHNSLESDNASRDEVTAYIETRVPELVRKIYGGTRAWLKAEQYEQLLSSPAELKRCVLHGHFDSCANLSALLLTWKPDAATVGAAMKLLEKRPELADLLRARSSERTRRANALACEMRYALRRPGKLSQFLPLIPRRSRMSLML